MIIDPSLPLLPMDENSSTGPILLLTQLSRLVNRRSTPELLGQTLKELAALSYLRDNHEVSQQALADGLCVDANYCVLVLNELESDDLIERRRDPTDRRRHLVSMTAAGEKALHQAEAGPADPRGRDPRGPRRGREARRWPTCFARPSTHRPAR